MKKTFLPLLLFVICLSGLKAQTDEHKWVNEMLQNDLNNLIHETYYSKIHQTTIGYTISLPQGYEEKKNANKRYPVVYFLHGGNPGNETRTG